MDIAGPQDSVADMELQVWHIDLDRTAGDLTDGLSTDEVSRAQRFIQERDRNRFVRARGAMRTILGNCLGVSAAELEFGLGEHGKPFIRRPESNLEFNLTHSRGMALLAVSETGPVGIDLECIRSRPSQLKIAQRLFPAGVYQILSALPADQLAAAFTERWTEFEARAKLHGAGIFSAKVEQDGVQTTHFSPQQGWIACTATLASIEVSMELQHFSFE
ncbi:MAG: 4'-phosphopantetheinyl transferase superfamily protein [Gammaproteobacteria bacterium]|nr:4'-phosphopantetheinyl transferase superfamily protein [Gammaproteobacteria bacterium]